MPSSTPPVEGNWYDTPEGQSFFVVTLDEDEGIVEIQYVDGSIEEVDLEAWDDLEVEPIDEPEDWIGPYDELEEDEYDGYGSGEMDAEEWDGPVDD